MKYKNLSALMMVFIVLFGLQVLLPEVLSAEGTFERVSAETEGVEQEGKHSFALQRDSVSSTKAPGFIPDQGLLLIPESTNQRVMAFDPVTGDLIDANFIPSDPANLSTPIHAILSADGKSILVSDQIKDVVQRYDFNGNYVGVFAPTGG